MRLVSVTIKNFRSYKGEYTFPIEGLTAFVGRNDAGKSTVMEALAIFFDHPSTKMELNDLNVKAEEKLVNITCEFADLPKEIVLDKSSQTSFEQEQLLNERGNLEITKSFKMTSKQPKASIFVTATHAIYKAKGSKKGKPLILFINEDLKEILKETDVVDQEVDKRSNVEIRQAIRDTGKLARTTVAIPLDEDDTKALWAQISDALPTFALFKSDRASTDEDSEVQDPMKAAISIALKEIQPQLEEIKNIVRERALSLAKTTVRKLHDIDSKLASELNPDFKAEPKWDGIFKLSLTDENSIPLNKRGSGVRRLILLSFFRAQAEKQMLEEKKNNVIFAVEEPETSQHPNNQITIIEALKDLVEAGGCQVLITTHVPALASLLPTDSLRFIRSKENYEKEILMKSEALFESISQDLGVLPDARVKVIVCVEGKYDIEALKHFSTLLRTRNQNLPCLKSDPRILLLPLGGSTLKDWVNKHYLRNLGRPEIHIYDRDDDNKYQATVEQVNNRGDGSKGYLTNKRELENYLHPLAIKEALNLEVGVDDTMDLPLTVAKMNHQNAAETSWDQLSDDKRKDKCSRAKKTLNTHAIEKITLEHLDSRNATDELTTWLQSIKVHL